MPTDTCSVMSVPEQEAMLANQNFRIPSRLNSELGYGPELKQIVDIYFYAPLPSTLSRPVSRAFQACTGKTSWGGEWRGGSTDWHVVDLRGFPRAQSGPLIHSPNTVGVSQAKDKLSGHPRPFLYPSHPTRPLPNHPTQEGHN